MMLTLVNFPCFHPLRRSEALADLSRDIKEGSSSPDRHWMFGTGPSPLNITPFQAFKAGSDTAALDILWACPGDAGYYSYFPNFHKLMLHSCAAVTDGEQHLGQCCGQDTAPAHVVFQSWFRLSDVSLSLTYDVQPDCGDGLTVTCEWYILSLFAWFDLFSGM